MKVKGRIIMVKVSSVPKPRFGGGRVWSKSILRGHMGVYSTQNFTEISFLLVPKPGEVQNREFLSKIGWSENLEGQKFKFFKCPGLKSRFGNMFFK